MERKDSNSGVENTKTFLFPFFCLPGPDITSGIKLVSSHFVLVIKCLMFYTLQPFIYLFMYLDLFRFIFEVVHYEEGPGDGSQQKVCVISARTLARCQIYGSLRCAPGNSLRVKLGTRRSPGGSRRDSLLDLRFKDRYAVCKCELMMQVLLLKACSRKSL